VLAREVKRLRETTPPPTDAARLERVERLSLQLCNLVSMVTVSNTSDVPVADLQAAQRALLDAIVEPPTTPPACPDCGGSGRLVKHLPPIGDIGPGRVEGPCPNPIHQRKEGERRE